MWLYENMLIEEIMHIMEKINSSLNLFFIVILFFGVFTLLVELFSADEFV